MTIPKVGMCFESENDAYEMYNTYAGTVGFSIRKSDIKRRTDKTIYSKLIVCSNHVQKLDHHMPLQGRVAMLVLSLVYAERGFGQ